MLSISYAELLIMYLSYERTFGVNEILNMGFFYGDSMEPLEFMDDLRVYLRR